MVHPNVRLKVASRSGGSSSSSISARPVIAVEATGAAVAATTTTTATEAVRVSRLRTGLGAKLGGKGSSSSATAAAAQPNKRTQHSASHLPPTTNLSRPRTRVKAFGLTTSVKKVAHMVFKRDHSTVAGSESPKLATEDTLDSKKLRASSPLQNQSPVEQLPASPSVYGSSIAYPPSSPTNGSNGGGVYPELPDFLTQDRHTVLRKFKLIDAHQRDRIIAGTKDPNHEYAIDTADHITERNRYSNISAWSRNRVKLGIDAADNDYINASHISIKNTKTGEAKNYIATQGPKASQARHLWLMALEQTAGPGVVVMLTKTWELGREKCYEYFPLDPEDGSVRFDRIVEEGEERVADPFNFEVNLLDCYYDEDARTEVRELEIRVLEGTHEAAPDSNGFCPTLKAGDTKLITHLLFKGWPDWNAPEGKDSDALLKLIELANSKNTVANSPLIVHCSAGVGRSGTFIALDHLLKELDDDILDAAEGDPIYDLVSKLREQRMYMVQSEAQYEYIYKTIREKLETKLGIPPGSRYLSPSSTPGMRTPSLRTLSRKPSAEPVAPGTAV